MDCLSSPYSTTESNHRELANGKLLFNATVQNQFGSRILGSMHQHLTATKETSTETCEWLSLDTNEYK